MKKTLLVMLALIMSLATVISTVALASADDSAAADIAYIDASLNEVEIDGEISTNNGKALTFAEDKITITGNSVAPTADFVLDTVLENVSVGAAWSQTEANVYFGIQSASAIEYVSIEIGGKTAELDASMTSSVTGVTGAFSAKSDDDTVIEIAIPIEGLELKNNGRYLYADLAISITADGTENTFVGGLQFTDYSANFALNAFQKHFAPVVSDTSSIDDNNVIKFVDETPNNHRSAAIIYAYGAIQSTKNMAIEFDINVKEMPYSQVFGGGPGMWQSESEGQARMWFCVKHRYNDQLYFNIINHVDDGIVLIIQEQANAPQVFNQQYSTPADPQAVVLGKDAGELFTLKIEWNENNHGIVSVDGKKVYETDRTKSDSPQVGTGTGFILANTQTPAEFDPGAKIDVEISNVSVSNLVDSYDINVLATLAGSDVDTGVEGGNNNNDPTDEEPKDEAPEGDGNDNADTTDTPSDEEKKGGCGGSLAGMSVAMIAGTALVTAICSSKKRRK